MGISTPNNRLFNISKLTSLQFLLASICFGTFLVGILICFLWTWNNWRFHPLSKDLLKYGSPWRSVASSINLEYRRLEKFSSVNGGTSIYVTDSWIIKCSTYKVYVAQQTEAHLSVIQSEDFLYNQDTNQSAQFLTIVVMTIPPHEQKFHLNLNALEYNDLKDRLSSPIRQARDIIIHQSLSHRFLSAFRHQVAENGTPDVLPLFPVSLKQIIFVIRIFFRQKVVVMI